MPETFSNPGTGDVTSSERKKLSPLIKEWMSREHPFTACVKHMTEKEGLSEDHAKRRCAVIKDLGTGTTKWRGKKKK